MFYRGGTACIWVTIRDEYCIEIVKPEFDTLLVLGYAIAIDNVEHQRNK